MLVGESRLVEISTTEIESVMGHGANRDRGGNLPLRGCEFVVRVS